MIDERELNDSVRAAEFVLGLLEPDEAAEAVQWIRGDRAAAAMALAWEDHFLSLSDRLTPIAPDLLLWTRIAHSAGLEAHAGSAPVRTAGRSMPSKRFDWRHLWESATAWRWASGAFAAGLLVLALMPALSPPPEVSTRIAVLQVPGESAKPGWVVSVTREGDVLIEGRDALADPAGKSIQIWTKAPTDARPRSLGLLADRTSVRIPAEQIGTIARDQLFEFTMEQKGGSPTDLPTGPVLYIGRIVVAQG